MRNVTTSRICFVCLLTGLLTSVAQSAAGFSFGSSSKDPGNTPRTTTNRPWGNIGAFKPSAKFERNFSNNGSSFSFSYSYSSQNAGDGANSGQYLGSAPGTGWPGQSPQMAPSQMAPYASQMGPYSQQYSQPYGSQMPQGAANGQPYVEVEVTDTAPYEQQNIVYTVRVVSTENIKTLDPILPRIEGAVLEKVDGPAVSVRNKQRNSSREIINQYHFKLTPIRSGEISIPDIRFRGGYGSNRQRGRMPGMSNAGGNEFTIASSTPLTLDVQPAESAVEPWLPLNDLRLETTMQPERSVKEGTPVTVTLELKAKGAQGDQLPSLESQLKSKDFRVYRESTTVKNGVSKNGKHLTGSRKETYTLIPLKDGWIRLPDIGVAWWNVDTHAPEMAGSADQGGGLFSARNGLAAIKSAAGGAFPSWFWFPLLLTLGLIIGYWLGAWGRTRPLLLAARNKTGALLQTARQHTVVHTREAIRAVSISPHVDKLRMQLAYLMPRSVKVWFCSRCIEQEDNPRQWCHMFKERVCKHLKMSPHAPLQAIADKLIEASPQAEPAKIRALVQSLDGAIYGGRDLDFMAWKRDLNNQLRPRARFHRRRRFEQRLGSELPKLNPHSA